MPSSLSFEYALVVVLLLVWRTKSDNVFDTVKCKEPFKTQCKCGNQGVLEDVYVESCHLPNTNSNICQPCPGACGTFSRCKTCSTSGCLTCPQGKTGKFCEVEDSSGGLKPNGTVSLTSKKNNEDIREENSIDDSTEIPLISQNKEIETKFQMKRLKFRKKGYNQDKHKNSRKHVSTSVNETHSIGNHANDSTASILEIGEKRVADEFFTEASAYSSEISRGENVSNLDRKSNDSQIHQVLGEFEGHEGTSFNADKAPAQSIKEVPSLKTVHPPLEKFTKTSVEETKKRTPTSKTKVGLKKKVLKKFTKTSIEETKKRTPTSKIEVGPKTPEDNSRRYGGSKRIYPNRKNIFRMRKQGLNKLINASLNETSKNFTHLSNLSVERMRNEPVVNTTRVSYAQDFMKFLMKTIMLTPKMGANENTRFKNIPIEKIPKDVAPKTDFDEKDNLRPKFLYVHSSNRGGVSRLQHNSNIERDINIIKALHQIILRAKNPQIYKTKPKVENYKTERLMKLQSMPFYDFLNVLLNAPINTESRHESTSLPVLKPSTRFDILQPHSSDASFSVYRDFQAPKSRDPLSFGTRNATVIKQTFRQPMREESFVWRNMEEMNKNKAIFENKSRNPNGWKVQQDPFERGYMLRLLPSSLFQNISKSIPTNYSSSKLRIQTNKPKNQNGFGELHPIRTSLATSSSCNSARCNKSTTSNATREDTRPRVTISRNTSLEKTHSFKKQLNTKDKIRIRVMKGYKKGFENRKATEQYTERDDLVNYEEFLFDDQEEARDDNIQTSLTNDEVNSSLEEELTTVSKYQEHLFRMKRKTHSSWCSIKKMTRHGNLDCKVWSYQKICKLTCHEGYSSPTDKYRCGAKKGKWSPPLKPCKRKRKRPVPYRSFNLDNGTAVDESIQLSKIKREDAKKGNQTK